MKEHIVAENFAILEAEDSDFDRFIAEEFRDTHPERLVLATFPEKVMGVICADHHKSKDGILTISYDHFEKKWYISHPGYIREVEVEGESFLGAANEFLRKIRRENEVVMFRDIEDRVNELIPKDKSIEIGENSITLYDCSHGWDRMRQIRGADITGKTLEEVVAIVNDMIGN